MQFGQAMAGSEQQNYSVITHRDSGVKRVLVHVARD